MRKSWITGAFALTATAALLAGKAIVIKGLLLNQLLAEQA